MKKSALLFSLLLLSVTMAVSQIQTPSLSPLGKVEQRIGLVDVSVEYSRPSKKGRVIFGDLVPYDTPWRTGANAATKITFSDDVMFGGAEVKKGTYALITKPGEKTWSLMLYPHNNNSWSSYLESDVQPVTVTTESIMMPNEISVETFMMGFDNLSSNSGMMYMLWDKTFVPVDIKVNTEKAVEESIAKVMAGPTAGDYYSAASYYWNEKKDLNQALAWVNKSVEMGNEKFWVLRTKSLIQAELGDTQGAIASATRSLELAKEAKNEEFIKMNEESLMKWRKG
jgi:hypothetical protein